MATKKGKVMGRPKIFTTPIRRLITFEIYQWEKLQMLAEKRGVSVPQVVRDLVDKSKT